MDEIVILVVAIVICLTVLLATVLYFLYLCGVTQSVEVGAGAPPIGKVTMAYKFGKGPYNEVGGLFAETLKVAPPKTLTMGIYYDDPNKIPAEKLRYAVGAILSEDGIKVEKEVIDTMKNEGFEIIELPKIPHCVKTEFPFICFLSIYLAVWKVYPCISRYLKENALCAYPMIEIYRPDKIHFMAPLSQQDDFYVPEAKANIPEEYGQCGDDSSLDHSMLDSSRPRDDRGSEESGSCVSSRFGDDYDSEDDETDDNEDIQDSEVSSTIDVRPSKACTDLLRESEEQEHMETVKPEKLAMPAEDTNVSSETSNLHDSGICSGRASTSPTQSNLFPETSNTNDEDSSSSFEEIKMETVEEEMTTKPDGTAKE